MPDYIFSPTGGQEALKFYFVWIVVYILCHIIWDIFSDQTEQFHLGKLASKISTLYSALTFANSLFLLTVILNGTWAEYVGEFEFSLALLMASLTGILVSMSEFSPKRKTSSYDSYIR